MLNFDTEAYLRDCRHLSPGANGLWIKMICLMDQAEPRGYLPGPDGKKPTLAWIADQVGMEKGACHAYLCELHGGGIFSVSPDGLPYSRRMVRERQPGERLGEAAKRLQAGPSKELVAFVDWWNGLVDLGLVKGRVGNPPNLDVCRAWIRAEADPEIREMLERRPEIENAILDGGEWLKSWLTLAGLLAGKNGDRELKLRKLLDGFYKQDFPNRRARGGETETERRLAEWGLR